MEEKYRIEELTRKTLNKYGMDTARVALRLGYSMKYVVKVLTKYRNSMKKDPDLCLMIAVNISTQIIEGFLERVQNLRDMLASLIDREQMLVCDICESEAREMKGQGDNVFFCPKCNKIVQRKLIDRSGIFDLKMRIIEALRIEYVGFVDTAVKMGWINKSDVPPPPTVKQSIMIFGTEKERKLIEGYSNMRPQDRALLSEKIRKDLMQLDIEIEQAPDTPNPAETGKVEEPNG